MPARLTISIAMGVIAHPPLNSGRQPRWLGWKVMGLLATRRRILLGLAGLILIAAGFDIAVPFLTQQLIDRILHSFGSNRGQAIQTLISAAAAIFVATALTRVIRSFYNYQLMKSASKAEDTVKTAAFANFLRQDTAYQSSVNTGEVVGALDQGGTAIFII